MGRRIAVAVEGLCRRYGRRWALVDVGFELAEGDATMVAGRNGSGKSTLLRLIATAIRPDRGAIRVLGNDARLDRDAVRADIALLDHCTHLYEPLTALENLELVARFSGKPFARPALLERLEEVGLADRADDAVRTLSAGMRKRLALARVLQQDARVVLLDEPYGDLDPPGFLLVDGILRRLRARDVTVIMATHLLRRGQDLCSRALVLESGRLVFSGPTATMRAPGGVDPAGFVEGT
jgi:heme exporter protein A